jgi:hypothetical protein
VSNERTVTYTVLSAEEPAVVDGVPCSPQYWARLSPGAIARQGPGHISSPPAVKAHAANPPATGAGLLGRWVASSLPAPPAGGYYWLGDPSSSDGTARIGAGAHQWGPHPSTPHAPAWRSFFPFKPSVRAYDSYLPGGAVVHHPEGVHFNPHFIEHMWLTYPGDHRQPFTWAIAAMIVHYPSASYRHFLLDAGRDPEAVGFPRISAAECNNPHRIDENLPYRTTLSVAAGVARMATTAPAAQTVQLRVDAAIRPKMFFGVFNGSKSYLGVFDPGNQRIRKASVANGPAFGHRFYTLGRSANAIDQDYASHLLVFEIRHWAGALSTDELGEQYKQLAGQYQFGRYRAL